MADDAVGVLKDRNPEPGRLVTTVIAFGLTRLFPCSGSPIESQRLMSLLI